MPSRKKGVKTHSMFTEQHSSVLELLKTSGLKMSFHPVDTDKGTICAKETNVVGEFICNNKPCKSKGWASGVVATVIRLYPDNRYNARVYHQRCKKCNTLSRPKLDESYAERVAYRLKKWNDIDVEEPVYNKESKEPHKTQLCEGCKAGHCRQSNMNSRFYSKRTQRK
ncbi:3CxxC-type zinc finger protein [Aspergillus mulundensis]|uniref:3CxxC-type domain-containing protein n=1 Tax=Aspergillus mulundensis TaxID=1810919 RepID=A0A3D8SBY5_9EURO|nr:hypothetical protein DSM5745_04119 [Aspergillus mulundensis]RDW83793.1 hypothetical protein DSM5745_04119 [Aspergillus mulundensis]